MLTDLKNRGILDACIVCCDGLKGLPEAINAVWPQAIVQTCVVHLVRNSLRYSSKQHWQRITGQLRRIYTAPTVEAAEFEFEIFAEEWDEKYPAMIKLWRNAWAEFVPFLDFPVEVRKIIYRSTPGSGPRPGDVGTSPTSSPHSRSSTSPYVIAK